MTGDTPLHVAAQYNHHTVMDVLLKHHADLYLRNIKEESALDLAAQYGRFDAVQMLVFKDLGILKEAVHKHSPLHLAARNGHVSVVNLLLDSGMPINALCDMGTALHAAALFGKVAVAKLLLRRGINIEIEDSNGQKVVHLLCKIPSKVSQQINMLIYQHSGLIENQNRKQDHTQRQRPESMPTRRLPTYDYVPSFKNPSETLDTRIDDQGQYSQVQRIEPPANSNTNSNTYELASLTGSVSKDASYMSAEEVNSPHSLVDVCSNSSGIGSYKKLEYSQGVVSTDEKDELLEDDYLEMDEVLNVDLSKRSSIPDFPPPSPNTASSIVSEFLRSSSIVSRDSDALSDADLLDETQQAMLTDAANNLLGVNKNLSRSVPLNIGWNSRLGGSQSSQNENESYDNVVLKNTPVTDENLCSGASPDLSSYDNVNLCSTLKVSQTSGLYTNVDFSSAPPDEELPSSYDNVLLRNTPIPPNEVSPTVTKEKSVKQKRTKDTITSQQTSTSISSQYGEPYDSHLKPAPPSDVLPPPPLSDDENTPIPKPRTKVKQTRTSVKARDVSDGYRMSEIINRDSIDVTYEWNKIDKFVSDLELYAEEPEGEENLGNMDTILSWLVSLGLSQYEPMFITNGFDEVSFLNGIVKDEDLIRLGILHSEHRKKILDSIPAMPDCPVFGTDPHPFPSSVREWLLKLKLPQYERQFNYYGYTNMERVRVIWELELVTVLEVTTVGHYKRMLCSLGKRDSPSNNGGSWSPTKLMQTDSSSKSSLTVEDDSMNVAKQLLETAESLKIERTQRLISTRSDTFDQSTQEEDSATVQPIDVVASRSVSCEWIHSSATLLAGSVTYTLQYLGSHPVEEVKGVESTLEACTKMKKMSRNIHKMPWVMLSISVRGIDYMDANTKMVISQYAINNISYCAQDTLELDIFAYITRDECTHKHYCHVFKVKTVELADEIIITIGQCFELAYQIHLETINNRDASSSSSMSRAMSLASRLPDRQIDVTDSKIVQGLGGRCNTEAATSPRVPPRPPKPYTGNVSNSNAPGED